MSQESKRSAAPSQDRPAKRLRQLLTSRSLSQCICSNLQGNTFNYNLPARESRELSARGELVYTVVYTACCALCIFMQARFQNGNDIFIHWVNRRGWIDLYRQIFINLLAHRLWWHFLQEQRDGSEESKAKLLPDSSASQAKQQLRPPFRRQAQLLPRVPGMMGSLFSALCAPLWSARLLAKDGGA